MGDAEYSYWQQAGRMRLSRRRALASAVAGAGVAGLAACGSSRPGGSASSPAAGSAQQPKTGGTITARVTIDPFDWDVTYLGKTVPSVNGIRQAYSSLLSFKSGPNIKYDDLVLQPSLAEKWETPDGQTYTFHLRKGARFANVAPLNGREVTAEDVKFSYEYLSRTGSIKDKNLPAADQAWQFEGMSGIQTPDASTVVVKFDSPFVPFLNYMGSDQNPIMAREIFDQFGSFKDRIIGSGAWQLDSAASQKGTKWVWKRNPTYWDSGKPYIDQITWLVIQDDAAALAAFQTKQVDILTGGGYTATTQVAQQIAKQRPDAVIDSYLTPSPVPFYMMVSKPPLSDLRVRKAIGFGIDRDEFVKTFTDGKGGWALAGAAPDTFSQEEIKQMLKYDPAQAKSLLASAGFANGLDMEFLYPGKAYGEQYVQEVELMQAQLKKVGVNLTLVTADKQDWLARERKHQFQVTFPAGKSLGEDIDSYLFAVFAPGSGTNYGDVNDPQLTPLLQAQRRETDATKRKDIIRQAVKRINVDMAWGFALFYPTSQEVRSPRVRNFAANFGSKGWPLEQSWLS